ncbi:MAG TPA: carboxypeptidase-like regulatory domain-containing protein [Candidatus Polarisedimenticolia bacterium]|nr:carboxypeptidase-like regulatory domain-containing protein [Candidatus Polarisedimenticolia bacterium]
MIRPRARGIRTLAAASAIALALVTTGPARAQGGVGQVNGTVTDAARKGVVGLSVAAIPQNGATVYGTNTDDGGRYSFRGLETDTYSLIVMLPGGGSMRKDGIRVRALFRSIVDFPIPSEASVGTLPEPRIAPHEPESPADAPAADAPPPAGASLALSIECSLAGPAKDAAPDAWMTLTPIGGAGRLRRGRTGEEGRCGITDVAPGMYKITAQAPGYMTWTIAPVALNKAGRLRLALNLVPFPMGFTGTLEDLLIPVDPIPPRRP